MLRAVVCVAFFGLLRCSEFVSPTQRTWDPSVTLSVRDVSFRDGGLALTLRRSKTDPFQAGSVIFLVPLRGRLCPVRALHKYVNLRGLDPGPLFVLQDGRFLTRQFLCALLDAALPGAVNLNTHSFRIGGATAAARAGLPDSLIQLLGRWKSNAFKKYIRASIHLEIAGRSAISRGLRVAPSLL